MPCQLFFEIEYTLTFEYLLLSSLSPHTSCSASHLCLPVVFFSSLTRTQASTGMRYLDTSAAAPVPSGQELTVIRDELVDEIRTVQGKTKKSRTKASSSDVQVSDSATDTK